MKLKIVTDGTFRGTRVETEDGVQIERVGGVTWSADTEFPGKSTATIRLVNPELEVVPRTPPDRTKVEDFCHPVPDEVERRRLRAIADGGALPQ